MQRADLVPCDRELAHVEELDLRQRAAVRLLQDVERGRALDLEAVDLASPRRVGGRALVTLDADVVPAGLRVVLDPVVRGRAADEAHPVLVEEEEDPVSDHVAVVVAGDELLRLVHGCVLERVDAEVGEEPDHVGALDVEIRHVVRLVEERARVAPRGLLVPPVRELTRHRRIDVRADLRVARHLDRAARPPAASPPSFRTPSALPPLVTRLSLRARSAPTAGFSRAWWSRPRNVFAHALVPARALSLTTTGPSSIDSSSP